MTASTQGMLDRTLYVALSRLATPDAVLAPVLAAHLAFMIELEARGVLFASGPFVSDGKPSGAGLTIVRAGSADEARAILAGDPFVVAGLRAFEIHEWHLMEGALHLTVLASQQRGVVP
jgi:uncharacterized protein YciI